jgi:DNA mismatch repair protein MSH5
VKNGRHPLQELTVDAFVPNDTCICEDKFMTVISGPNSSGKSVYLKQIGLLVYLAHIGSWLPCDKAVIGLTDR